MHITIKVIAILLVFVFIYSFILGAVNQSQQHYETGAFDSDDLVEVFTYEEFENYIAYMEMNMEEVKYSGWQDGEEARSDRIRIGPVYHSTEYYDIPDRREIFEPDSWGSKASQWLGWLPYLQNMPGWKMVYEDWDHGTTNNISYSEDVYIYPHVYYNSPGVYRLNNLDDVKWLFIAFPTVGHWTYTAASWMGTWTGKFLTITGFDSTRGKMFAQAYNEEVSTGYGVSLMERFYAGIMPSNDLLYTIDVCIVKEEGLMDMVIAMLNSGLTYSEVAEATGAHLAIAERYRGRISGDSGPPDTFYDISVVAPHESDSGNNDGLYAPFNALREMIKNLAAPDDSPGFIKDIHYGLFIGPIVAILAFFIARYALMAIRGV